MEDFDVRKEFLQEAVELVEKCESYYESLSKNLSDTGAIDALFRSLHTIKGSAGVAKFERLSHFVHKIEDVINIYREKGHVPLQSHTVLLDCHDILNDWIEQLHNDRDFAPDTTSQNQSLELLLTKENVEYAPATENINENVGFAIFSEEEQNQPQQARILAVDDDKEIIKVIETYLADENFDLTTASSGTEALNILQNSRFDVIISDLKMPAMTGVDFIKEVRAFDDKVEVIFMTAHASRSSLEEFMKLRAFSFVDKTEAHIQLVPELRKAIKSKKVKDALALMTKLNFEIHLDFNLIRKRRDRINIESVESRINDNLERVAKLSSIIADPELVLQTDLHKFAA